MDNHTNEIVRLWKHLSPLMTGKVNFVEAINSCWTIILRVILKYSHSFILVIDYMKKGQQMWKYSLFLLSTFILYSTLFSVIVWLHDKRAARVGKVRYYLAVIYAMPLCPKLQFPVSLLTCHIHCKFSLWHAGVFGFWTRSELSQAFWLQKYAEILGYITLVVKHLDGNHKVTGSKGIVFEQNPWAKLQYDAAFQSKSNHSYNSYLIFPTYSHYVQKPRTL